MKLSYLAIKYFSLDFFPEIVLNKATRFRGSYRLGDYGDPEASDYLASTRPGVDVATSDGQWTMWWIATKTPWGIMALGKRPMAWGSGLQYNGAGNVTTEGVTIVSNYGPLRVSYAFRPYYQQPPNRRVGQQDYPYYNVFDKNGVRSMANRIFVTYRSGSLDMGVLYSKGRWRAGPESQSSQVVRDSFMAYDEDVHHGGVYAKYDNGRVFVNGEVAFFERVTKRMGATLEPHPGVPMRVQPREA